jgi:hypothetical protein
MLSLHITRHYHLRIHLTHFSRLDKGLKPLVREAHEVVVRNITY